MLQSKRVFKITWLSKEISTTNDDPESSSREVICMSVHTNWLEVRYAQSHSFRALISKKTSLKTMGTHARIWPDLPADSACLRLVGTQQEPLFNLAPLQSKEWCLQWHLPKKSLKRQSISEMLRHNFLLVSHLLLNTTNSLQAYITSELLPCQH